MGKGGGGGDTTQTVYQQQLPAYAEPYYKSLLDRAETESTRPYQPYPGQRIGDLSQATQQALGMASAFANSGMTDMDNARSLAGLVGQQAIDLSNYEANGVTNGYQGPADWANTQFNANQLGFSDGTQGIDKIALGEFDQAARDKYMSPYMEDVIATSQSDAQQKALQEQAYLKGEAAKAGAFGGSRGAIQQQLALNDAQKRIAQIGVEGRQAAFENAQAQFERDRAASLAAQGRNQEAALAMAQANQAKNLEAQQLAEQSKQFGYAQTEEGKRAAAQMNMDAQQLSEQLRQSGKQLGLSGLQLAGNTAGQLAEFQGLNDQMLLQRIQAQLGVGQVADERTQRALDLAYEDWQNQRDYNWQNLDRYSSLLHGLPTGQNTTQTTTTPSNNVQGGLATLYGMNLLSQLGRGQS